jgi:hypothetical protein
MNTMTTSRKFLAGILPPILTTPLNYLMLYFAQAASKVFKASSASSLLTPSLTFFGKPSIMSSSFNPNAVSVRMALITAILPDVGTSSKTKLNSVFSSMAGTASTAANGTGCRRGRERRGRHPNATQMYALVTDMFKHVR